MALELRREVASGATHTITARAPEDFILHCVCASNDTDIDLVRISLRDRRSNLALPLESTPTSYPGQPVLWSGYVPVLLGTDLIAEFFRTTNLDEVWLRFFWTPMHVRGV